MPVIFCKINLFNLYQEVLYINELGEQYSLGSIPLTELATTLVEYCYSKDVYHIQLVGGSYLEGIIKSIEQYNMTQYSQNHEIIIEVIK